jgi:hypothetical protein
MLEIHILACIGTGIKMWLVMMVSNLHKQVYNDLYIQVGLTFKSNPSISKFNFICAYLSILS